MDARKWKRDAIHNMNRSRAATLAVLVKMPRKKIVERQTQGAWSVKDVIAHIVAWEEVAIRRLKLLRSGRSDRIHFYEDIKETDRFNARVVRRSRSHSVSGVLKHAADVREKLIEELKALPPEAMNDPSHCYPVVVWLPEFAWTHERSHRDRIRKLLHYKH